MARLLTLLHSERPKLYAILASLSAIGLKYRNRNLNFTLSKDNLQVYIIENITFEVETVELI